MKSDILKDKNCLVIGATGNIGRGAVKAFLQHGAKRVVILGRSEQRLSDLARDYLHNHDGLIPVAADISTPEGAQEASQKVQSAISKLHHVVSSSGPWWNVNDLNSLDPQTWFRALQSNLTAHFLGFRFFHQLLQRNGSYVIMNGAAAKGLPQSGLTGICAYAVQGLCKVLQSEGKNLGIRVHELMLHFRVADGGPFPGMKSDVFGQVFAAIAAGKVNHAPGSTIELHREEDMKDFVQMNDI